MYLTCFLSVLARRRLTRWGRCAAAEFLSDLSDRLPDVAQVKCTLHGSLGATGVGHGTDRAVIVGLMGEVPETVNPKIVAPAVADVQVTGRMKLAGTHEIAFSPGVDIVLDGLNELPGHPNGMRLEAWNAEGNRSRTRFITRWVAVLLFLATSPLRIL